VTEYLDQLLGPSGWLARLIAGGGNPFLVDALAQPPRPAADSLGPIEAALAPAPNTSYGAVLPIAKDQTTGAVRWAMPSTARDLAQGVLDLMRASAGERRPHRTAISPASRPG
jgi:hypothetical protein